MDTRVKWFVELVVDGVLKIKFVRSDDNDADLWTKNVTRDLYNKHSKKIVWTTDDLGSVAVDDRVEWINIGKGVGEDTLDPSNIVTFS